MHSNTKDLRPLLEADSIVIVGASADFSRLGGMPIRSLLDGGFPASRMLLVNPKYAEIDGVACFPSIEALPWTPSLAVLAIRATDTLPALQRCHDRGIRAAVSFASGFAEEGADGVAMQQAIVAFADRTGMLVCGPNCIGFANFHRRLFATFLRNIARRADPGPLAVVAQSGNMAGLLRNIGLDAGLRYAHVVSTGNEACLDLCDYLGYFADDEHTGAVLAYAEQIRRGPEFLRVADALRAAGKPLFMLKAGTSQKGAEAAASHTAALAGSDVAFRSACRQLGVMTATDPHRLLDLVRLWHAGKRPAGRGACVVSLSGAGCALVADHLARDGVHVPTLGDATQRRLRAVVPSYGMVTNPVDLTGNVTNDRRSFPSVLEAIASAPEIDVAVFYVMGALLDAMAPDLIAVSQRSDTLLVVIDTADDARSHAALAEAGVVVFRDMNRASAALGTFLRWCARPSAGWRRPADQPRPAAAAAVEVQSARAESRSALTEVEAKALLGRHGIPVVTESVAADAADAVRMAASIGWPVAVKVLSPDIVHKTEVGGVRLDLRDADAVRDAVAAVMASARNARPDARIDGVVVQRMAGPGVPMLVGIVRDPMFGPMMTVGMGGIEAELDPDVAHRLLPVDAALAHEMIGELRRRALLGGWRGAPPADVDALVTLMVRLSRFMHEAGHDIDELELNPVLVNRHGAVAVDALIRLGGLAQQAQAAGHDNDPRRAS